MNIQTLLFLSPILAFNLSVTATHADETPASDGKPVLRWGADIESGAPFAYQDTRGGTKLIGFEAEIVEGIAEELGRTVVFSQNNWGGLVQGLQRNDYDIVVNGLEMTADRSDVVHFSPPYLVTGETLAVRRSTHTIDGIPDLVHRKVGTLTGSLAMRILNDQSFPIEVKTYGEEIHLYNDLAFGRLDAVLLDEPIALYYAKPNPELKLVGGRIGHLSYGVATRRGEPEFSTKIDNAIKHMIASGKLRLILEKWGLWNEPTALAWGQSVEPQTPPRGLDNFLENSKFSGGWRARAARYWSFMPRLAKGAWMTLQVSILSMLLAMVLGLIIALNRLYGPSVTRWIAVGYIELFRGTPLLIQLYLIFYGLPHIGVRINPFAAAILGLGLNYGAAEAEIYRAGILAIPKSQMDASQALGMTWWQSLRHIILPQAIRMVIPPITNDFIALLKDSSLVSVITMVELTSIYGQLASTYFDYLGIGLLTALVYFVIGLPFVRISRKFERDLNAHVRKRPGR